MDKERSWWKKQNYTWHFLFTCLLILNSLHQQIHYCFLIVSDALIYLFCCRIVAEAKDSEYKAWAQIESLKSSLNEHHLELRVKTAIEAEALSQQTLAAAEAEIADLRQKLEASKRYCLWCSGILVYLPSTTWITNHLLYLTWFSEYDNCVNCVHLYIITFRYIMRLLAAYSAG